jgi:HEPN domain-containing protein
MITRSDLIKIARARLRDAEVLYRSRRYDGAIYLCGYAVEIALKVRICRTLSWPGYPSTGGEFQNYQLPFRVNGLALL